MNRKNFLLLFFIEWLLTALVKVWLLNNFVFANAGLQELFFWFLILIISAWVVKRFGIITFFEMGLIMFVWTVFGLFLDLIFTSKFTGLGIFFSRTLWAGYGVMLAAVFIFHKKKHLHMRHKLHAAKHAAAHAAAHAAEHPHMPEIKKP